MTDVKYEDLQAECTKLQDQCDALAEALENMPCDDLGWNPKDHNKYCSKCRALESYQKFKSGET